MSYDVVAISPDNEHGYRAIHEYLQQGYSVVYQYREPTKDNKWINHVFLRGLPKTRIEEISREMRNED